MLKAVAFLLAVSAAAGVAGPRMAEAASATVTIDNYKFVPAQVTVHPGDTVVWRNKDSMPHTATAMDGSSFDTGAIDPNGSQSAVLSKAGTYAYRCAIHPDMRGTIVVR